MKRSFLTLLSIVALLVMIPTVSIASSILIGDDNSRIGLVDTDTGVVSSWFDTGVGTGDDFTALTDIAYRPDGTLWGITLYQLYSIDVSGTATPIGDPYGSHFLTGFTFGSDGTAYAMGKSTTELYTLDTATGAATSIGDVGYYSDGDLAFAADGFLYLSATPENIGGNSRLVQIDMTTKSGSLLVGTDLGLKDVYGLAFTDGIMFGVAGTDIFQINLSAAAISDIRSFAGGELSIAYGASEPNPVPEPATMLLLGAGLAVLAGFRRKFRLL